MPFHQASTTTRKAPQKKQRHAASRDTEGCIRAFDGAPALPEFHLVLAPEPDADGQLKSSEQEHVKALLALYQREEGAPEVLFHTLMKHNSILDSHASVIR